MSFLGGIVHLYSGSGPFANELALFGEDLHRSGRGPDKHLPVQISTVYTVISIVKANMVVRGHLRCPPFHVFVRDWRQRHKLPAFFVPVVAAAVGLLGKRSAVELVQMLPEIPVELFQTEIVHFLHVMEESLFQNADGIFDGTLVLGFLYLGRKDNGVVVFCPLCIILVQLRVDPVLVGDDGLLAVVADHQSRNTPKYCKALLLTAIHCGSLVETMPSA